MENKKDKKTMIKIVLIIMIIGLCIGAYITLISRDNKETLKESSDLNMTKEIEKQDNTDKVIDPNPYKNKWGCPEKKEFKTNPYTLVFYLVGGIGSNNIFDENCEYLSFDKDSLNQLRTLNIEWDRSSRLKDNSEKEKLRFALEVISTTHAEISLDYDMLSNEVKEKIDRDELYKKEMKNNFPGYTYDDVNKIYKKLFGEELLNPESTYLYGGTLLAYDTINKVFVHTDLTDGASPYGENFLYINREENDEDYKYIYVNIGHTEGDDHAYNDFSTKDIIKSDIDYKTFTINESNYMLFKEHKYTFKKGENGEYYFVSFE